MTVSAAEPPAEVEEDPSPSESVPRCAPRLRPAKPIRTPAQVPVAPDDPVAGRFELTDAIRGLQGRWPLVAEIDTDLGTLSCELWDEVAPITVANFVGLARGLRPFRDGERWLRRPAYDGATFHRVIEGFVIQGGDPTGTGAGEAGYVIPNEIDESVRPDRVGLLYMAHRGPDTGSIQFFILDAAAPHIDGSFTAFGLCGPEDVIHAIASAPKMGERPEPPVRIRAVDVRLTPGCD